jgi:hypothetical protein
MRLTSFLPRKLPKAPGEGVRQRILRTMAVAGTANACACDLDELFNAEAPSRRGSQDKGSVGWSVNTVPASLPLMLTIYAISAII